MIKRALHQCLPNYIYTYSHVKTYRRCKKPAADLYSNAVSTMCQQDVFAISNIVVDVIRLLCGSLKIDGIRIENYNCLHSFYCSFCQRCVINPVHRALLYCMNTETQREYWWTWTTDNLSGDIMVLLNFLDDEQFVQLITGGKPANVATIMDSLNIDFWLRCAEYVSFCMQNSLFEPFG
jgi:hypothetical protein